EDRRHGRLLQRAGPPVHRGRAAGTPGDEVQPAVRRQQEGRPSMKDTKKSPKRATAARKASQGFSAEERAAMKEPARELKAEGAMWPIAFALPKLTAGVESKRSARS